jgi:hypothetical protein
MRCGYEVPGTNLLYNLKYVMLLDRSKDLSVYVLTCTSYDFNMLTLVLWKLWL